MSLNRKRSVVYKIKTVLKVRDEEIKMGNEEMQDKKRCRTEEDEDNKWDDKEENQWMTRTS